MTNRILVSPSAFNVSVPGADVLAASGTSLIFDGDQASPGKYITGSISGSRAGAGISTHTGFFGKTFSVKPFVMVNVVAGSGASFPGETYAIKGFGDSETPWNNFAFSWTIFEVKVGVDRVDFAFSSFSSSVSYTINYLVFDYRLGF